MLSSQCVVNWFPYRSKIIDKLSRKQLNVKGENNIYRLRDHICWMNESTEWTSFD